MSNKNKVAGYEFVGYEFTLQGQTVTFSRWVQYHRYITWRGVSTIEVCPGVVGGPGYSMMGLK